MESQKSKINEKMQILVDAKELLFHILCAIQRMPKIERIDGAVVEMKKISFKQEISFKIIKGG